MRGAEPRGQRRNFGIAMLVSKAGKVAKAFAVDVSVSA
jgi:hypothetical protein